MKSIFEYLTNLNICFKGVLLFWCGSIALSFLAGALIALVFGLDTNIPFAVIWMIATGVCIYFVVNRWYWFAKQHFYQNPQIKNTLDTICQYPYYMDDRGVVAFLHKDDLMTFKLMYGVELK
jgi:hypothetical protein